MIGISECPCIKRLVVESQRSELADAAIAELEAIQGQRDEFAQALREIRDFRAEYEPLRLGNEDCEACQRSTERQWPPSCLCDQHYRILADNRSENARRDAGQHWTMRHIAEAALDPSTRGQ